VLELRGKRLLWGIYREGHDAGLAKNGAVRGRGGQRQRAPPGMFVHLLRRGGAGLQGVCQQVPRALGADRAGPCGA